MAITNAVKRLTEMAEAPKQEDAFEDWIRMGSAFNFLRADLREDEFVVYASDDTSFIHAIAVPANFLNPPDIEDLMSWRTSPTSCWSIAARLSEPRDAWISHPLDDAESKALQRGEKLVYSRRFEGRIGQNHYYEVLQKFIHLFELHFMEERKAYLRSIVRPGPL